MEEEPEYEYDVDVINMTTGLMSSVHGIRDTSPGQAALMAAETPDDLWETVPAGLNPEDYTEVSDPVTEARKIWVLWSVLDDHPGDARYFTSAEAARKRGTELAESASRQSGLGLTFEWRPAQAHPGMMLPDPPCFGLVHDPSAWPDYQALWKIGKDGTEYAPYWQIDSVLLDKPEPPLPV